MLDILDHIVLTFFKSKEHLLRPYFGKVELSSIKGLEDLIESELGWPFLEVTTLNQYYYKTIISWKYLCMNTFKE